MKQPVDHILRSRLPWRDDVSLTECGLDASSVSPITRDQFVDRVKEMGQQRAALFTCMTCAQTARNWKTWEQDPRSVIEREIVWEKHGGRLNQRGLRTHDELIAIAALIAAHQEEFADLLSAKEKRSEWNKMLAEKKKGKRPTPW